MAEDNRDQDVLDAKYGVIKKGSIAERPNKKGGNYLTATLVLGNGNEKSLYVHKDELQEELRAKEASGQATVVRGKLLSAGRSLSVQAFAAKHVEGEVVEVTRDETNEYGRWAVIRLQIEGKAKPQSFKLIDEECEMAVLGGHASFDAVWVARKNESTGDWFASGMSVKGLIRNDDAPAAGGAASGGAGTSTGNTGTGKGSDYPDADDEIPAF